MPHEEDEPVGSGILEEIRRLRQEHKDAAADNKQALARVEKSIQDVAKQMSTLEKQTSELETRVGNTEDRMTQLEKAVVYLLQSEAKVAAKCNELEARGRRKNIRIHGVEERAEKNDVVGSVKELIRSKLDLPTAQLRIFSEDGTNRTETFASLKDAASMLRNMGISVVEEDESESEKIRHDILSGNWTLVTSQGQSKGPA
uniref:Uncharacterized protein n=1 Tax=Knipowitschia caucasica TaxID=637954 RepID=A0AAV2J8Z1_KNICA